MKTPKRERSNRLFVASVMVVYIAITLVVAWHHEPWRDEADVWLLLKDGGFGTMLARTGYVGMPSLWYLMVGVLTTLGLPYFSMTVLNLVVAWAAVLVFLVWAPFPRWIKVLFSFSYFIAYEYSVVARPYAVTILLLFSVMAAWRHRAEHPLRVAVLVALLGNATTHGLIIAAFLGVVFLLDAFLAKRWKEGAVLGAIVIMVLGGLLAVVQLIPPENTPKTHVVRGENLDGLIWAIGNAFFPGLFPEKAIWVSFFMSLGLLAVITVAIGPRWIAQIYLWCSLAAIFLLYAFVWVAGYRHAGLITLVVVTALWLATAYEPAREPWMRRARIALGLSLAYCALVAFRYWQFDLERPFSGAEEMGRYIAANGLDRYEIVAHKPPASEAVLPYLPGKRFYYAGMHEYGSYMLWDRSYNLGATTSYGVAVQSAQTEFAGRQYLLLVNEEMRNPEQAGFRLIFTNLTRPFEKIDERYWLYAPLDWPGEPLPALPAPRR